MSIINEFGEIFFDTISERGDLKLGRIDEFGNTVINDFISVIFSSSVSISNTIIKYIDRTVSLSNLVNISSQASKTADKPIQNIVSSTNLLNKTAGKNIPDVVNLFTSSKLSVDLKMLSNVFVDGITHKTVDMRLSSDVSMSNLSNLIRVIILQTNLIIERNAYKTPTLKSGIEVDVFNNLSKTPVIKLQNEFGIHNDFITVFVILLSNTLNISNSYTKSVGKDFDNTILLSDNILKSITKKISGTINCSNALTKEARKQFNNLANIAPSLTKTFSESFTNSIEIQNILNKLPIKNLSKIVEVKNNFSKDIDKEFFNESIIESVSCQKEVQFDFKSILELKNNKKFTISKTFIPNVINVTDGFKKTAFKGLNGSILCSNIFNKAIIFKCAHKVNLISELTKRHKMTISYRDLMVEHVTRPVARMRYDKSHMAFAVDKRRKSNTVIRTKDSERL